jgi:hypothetical protein
VVRFITSIRFVSFDNESEQQPPAGDQSPPVDQSPAPPKEPPGKGEKMFSQTELNKFLAEERRKQQSQTQKALDELQALKSKAELTASERHELDSRIESLQNELLTKEQLSKKEQDRIKKTYEDKVASLAAEKETWQGRYTESTIIRALTDAAAENEAFSPKQIVAILRQNTRLVDALEDGKPTGELTPKVRFSEAGQNGEVITLELSPKEAVKRMREQDEYLNLFKGEGSGGSGAMTRPGSKKPNISQLAQDPAAYREARKKGLVF